MAAECRRREARRLWRQAAALSLIAEQGYEAIRAQLEAAQEASALEGGGQA